MLRIKNFRAGGLSRADSTPRFPLVSGFHCRVLGVSLVPIVLGCSLLPSHKLSSPGSIAGIVQADSDSLEVSATPEEQARQEVLATPTVFMVPFSEDPHAWERARFFLENYASPGAEHASVVVRVVGSQWSLASSPAVRGYSYEVAKDVAGSGFSYRITCVATSGNDAGHAALNAGNLARFIREGKLELSLLVRG